MSVRNVARLALCTAREGDYLIPSETLHETTDDSVVGGTDLLNTRVFARLESLTLVLKHEREQSVSM